MPLLVPFISTLVRESVPPALLMILPVPPAPAEDRSMVPPVRFSVPPAETVIAEVPEELLASVNVLLPRLMVTYFPLSIVMPVNVDCGAPCVLVIFSHPHVPDTESYTQLY